MKVSKIGAGIGAVIAICCLAREKITLRRFSPPPWLIGPEVHAHLAVRPGRITDAHDDDVALVALHAFEIFDEQPGELAVNVTLTLALDEVRPKIFSVADAGRRIGASSPAFTRPLHLTVASVSLWNAALPPGPSVG